MPTVCIHQTGDGETQDHVYQRSTKTHTHTHISISVGTCITPILPTCTLTLPTHPLTPDPSYKPRLNPQTFL